MLDLADIPFFSPLPQEALQELRSSVEVRSYPAGSLICRKGEAGQAFFAIASGGVSVQLGKDTDPRRTSVFLGPGQVFGEMSLLSGLPVSATVVAAKDTWVYVLEKKSFLHFLETHSVLHNEVLQTLIERIRHRSSPETLSAVPGCALAVVSNDTALTRAFRRALFRATGHYAPGSFFIDTVFSFKDDPTPVDRPAFFPQSTKPLHSCRGAPCVYTAGESEEWIEQLIENWRFHGNAGQHLIVVVKEEVVLQLRKNLGREDRVLVLEDRDEHRLSGLTEGDFGLACFGRVRFGNRKSLDDVQRRGRWAFQLDPAELDRVDETKSAWEGNRKSAPTLDWIARWLTGREIGIALGAGAACGFAHLGVLQALEEAGIHVDYFCGSSMGGALALLAAMTGSAVATVTEKGFGLCTTLSHY